ncbi:MAG: disulfide bond formation protein B [Chlamydiales bacterium]
MKKILFNWGVFGAWVIALFAVLVSLYWSEVLGAEPCSLCWMQRVFLFPLVLLLGIALFRADRHVTIDALPLALFGGGVALYHVVAQRFDFSACGETNQCTQDIGIYFGWLTPPMLSVIAFLSICICLWWSRPKKTYQE